MKEARDPERADAEQVHALRQRAEERLRVTGSEIRRMSTKNVQRLVHELQVSQIELLLQNEELQRTQAELAAARDRYSDWYDFAPVGYVTLTPEGVIQEANLAAAELLGTERIHLVGTLLSRFISTNARDTLYHHLYRLRAESAPGTCEVSVPRPREEPLILQLDSVAVHDEKGGLRQYRTILSDITARKEAEAVQQALSRQLLEVQEHERRHLARELHDEVMQTLATLRFNLETIEHEVASSSEPVQESIELVDDLVEQVRNLALDLRPSVLDDLGLVAALDWYLKRQAPRVGIQMSFSADPLLSRLHPLIETTCFRVVQEALTNVAKHAQAQHVWVELRQQAEAVHISIRDDGIGFDPAAARQRAAQGSGLGLRGMEERLWLVGGHLDILSTPGGGCEIHANVPLREPRTNTTVHSSATAWPPINDVRTETYNHDTHSGLPRR